MSFMSVSCLVICSPSVKLLVIAIVLLSLINLDVVFQELDLGRMIGSARDVVDSIFFKMNHFPINQLKVRVLSLFMFPVIKK